MLRLFSLLLLVFLSAPVCLSGRRSPSAPFNWNTPRFHELSYAMTLEHVRNWHGILRSGLIAAIEARLRPSMADLGIADEQELLAIAKRSRVEFVDLNEDGSVEAVVQPVGPKSGCGATGNCPFWIFAVAGKRYKTLMDIGGVQMFRVETQRVHQYHDIGVASHDSASEKHVYLYRYSGSQYRRIKCYELSWIDPSGGSLSQPLVTPCRTGGSK